MNKVAIILSGSGVFDGAEIHEATMTMLAVVEEGGEYQIFAPDKPQHHVINHLTGEEMNEQRNVLVESARIARGDIKPLSELNMNDFDALIMPGGFGVAKNLSDFAFKGAECQADETLEKIILQAVELEKPIGALCISPAIVARIVKGAKVTIGQDEATAKAIQDMGGTHQACEQEDVIIDSTHKIITTPCYMLDANIKQIADGARNVVKNIFMLLKGN